MIFLAYEIFREGQEHGVKWYCKAESWEQIARGVIERESEIIRDRFDNTYSGKHFVIRHWESRPRPEKFVRTRQESFGYRDLAFADVLDGPDTKTKRWLEKYLAVPKKTPKKAQEPVTIGQVVDDSILF